MIERAVMKLRPLSALLASAAVLAACATSTPYQPANNAGLGYTDQQIENDRWQLTFSGNTSTERATVEQYLLFRAAEITDQNGYDVFRIVRRDVDSESRFTGQSTGFGGVGGGFGGGFYNRGFGGGFATFTSRERQRFEAIAEIKLERGEPGEDDATAYVADEVLQTLAGAIQRPG
ncbi:MAG: hypothetical protein AAGJ32_01420 [Pseudomonadota bacterium]